jgi:outer membrane receptor protein involved in Fe transport
MSVHWRIISSALLGALSVTPSFAQQGRIEEIVVTAKQRTENLQDVPLAITAFTAADLQRRSIADVRDLAAFTPSFSFYAGTGRQDPTALVVRGLSPQTSDERYQGLSVFIDGVFIAGQLASVDLSNLERVEVIKGPQSATFGRSTYSGAIDYITAIPKGDRISGRVRARIGWERGADVSYLANARLDFPIAPGKLWGSLTGTLDRKGSLWENPSNGGPIGREDTKAIGGTLFAQPNDDLSLKLRVAYDRDRDSQGAIHQIEPAEWEARGAASVITRTGQKWIQGKIPEPSRGVTGGGEFLKADEPADMGRISDRYFGSAVVTYTFHDFTLTYTGGYFRQRYVSNGDFYYRSARNDPFFPGVTNTKLRRLLGTATAADLANIDGNNVAFQEEFENHSHQLRLVSPGDAPFRYKVGLYYTKDYNRNFRRLQASAANPTGRTRGDEFLENYAAFGGADLDLGSAFTFGAEARVARERVFAVPCAACITPTLQKDFRDTQFTPRVTLQFKPTADNMLYVLWSRGYKPARHNTSNPLPTALPERLDNYEIGAKNTFGNGRGILNLAAFYDRIANQQAFIPVNNPNAGQPGQPITLTGSGISADHGSMAWSSKAASR